MPTVRTHTYKIITNICFAVGVASVLLSNHVGPFNWVMGVLMIAATVVAATMHLYSQWHPPEAGVTQPQTQCPVPIDSPADPSRGVLKADQPSHAPLWDSPLFEFTEEELTILKDTEL